MEKIILTQGGVYLAKLNPSKHAEIGKIRPVIVLTAQFILDIHPVNVLVCPLSSKSYPECKHLHVQLPPRQKLLKDSYALIEHCRSISINRIVEQDIAHITHKELSLIFKRLQVMCEM